MRLGILGLFRRHPKWVVKLPPHLRPTPEQIERLEALRSELSISHNEFHLHIAGHRATTRRVQHHFYAVLTRQNPHLDHDQRLAALIRSRWQGALNAGRDLFGLGQCDADTFEARVVDLVHQAKTVDGLTDLFIEAESQWSVIPPAPGFEWAARRISDLLGEPHPGHDAG